MQSKRGARIRLTNKTAIELRRQARRTQSAAFLAAGIFTVAMALAAVLLGMRSLWAVVVVVAAAVLADALMIVYARARYYAMLGQAICTEAAARAIAEGERERRRERQAEQDMRRVRQDAQLAAREDAQARQRQQSPGVLSLEKKMSERRQAAQPPAPAQTPAPDAQMTRRMPPVGARVRGQEAQNMGVVSGASAESASSADAVKPAPRRRRRSALE